MSNLNQNEMYVLGLAKLNHGEAFESVDVFRSTLEMAQQGGFWCSYIHKDDIIDDD